MRFVTAVLGIAIGAAWIAGCALPPSPGGAAPVMAGTPTDKLEAAQRAWQDGNAQAAWQAAESLVISALPPDRQLTAAELKAEIALANHRPRIALKALEAAPSPVESEERARFLALKSRALFADGLPARGLELMVERGRLFTTAGETSANNQLTWALISGARPLPSPAGLSHIAQGWIALAHIQHTAWEEPQKFAARILKWSTSWPAHPANGPLLAQIQAEERARWQYPVKIAVLLPLSGDYAEQAQAVEAGMLAGYYRSAQPRPQVVVFDTGGTAEGARAALSKARAASANFVVGPLTPAGVNGIVPRRPVMPVLALNYLQDGTLPPPRFYQFGLSPEQQARSAAEHAISQGLSRAVVLVPANDWGQGIAKAFTQRLTELGGRVLAAARFQPGAVKFAAPLTSLFGIDLSRMREQRLSAQLQQQLEFTPRRRQDIQFVFFAAPFTTARLLVPQIDYYHGMGLPVYSIANLYQVGQTPDDLDGVRFPIMPWFISDEAAMEALRSKLAGLFPQAWLHYARLYALGYDAWRLIPLLANNLQPLRRPVRGVTGALSLGENNVIVRRAAWAHYIDGRLHPVDSGKSEP